MVVRVKVKSKLAHFGTAFSNHTSKMSYRVPSKSSLRGFVGAALGISFDDCQELPYRYNFKWVTRTRTQMVAQSRMVIENTNSLHSVVRSADWERGNLKRSIDYIEYVVGDDGYIEGDLLIEVLDGSEDRLVNHLRNPEFPLYLGSSECLVKVVDVRCIDIEWLDGTAEFSGMFVGEIDGFYLSERMPERMLSYRKPGKFEEVYLLENSIVGKSKCGYYVVDGENRSIY